jgi:hypothetical protein
VRPAGRKTLIEVRSDQDHERGDQATSTFASVLVLGSNGAVAWVNESRHLDQKLSVPMAVPRGAHTMLDIGNDIGSRSLALASDAKTIYWTRDGQVKTATLR